MQNTSVSGVVKSHSELSNPNLNGNGQRSIAELRKARARKAPGLPVSEERLRENEFLRRLLDNLRKPFYTVSQEEVGELKRLSLLNGEALCDNLRQDLFPKPEKFYISKKNYYVIPGVVTWSLDTGRIFNGKDYEEGGGDFIAHFRYFKNLTYIEAIEALARFLLRLREKEDRHRQSLCRPGVPLAELKQILWEVFEEREFLAGEKILFPKANGKRTVWTTSRYIWRLVWETFGENCRDSRYFASPPGMREFLDLFCGELSPGRFEVRRRHWPKTVPLDEAKKVEYSFVPTDYPLSF